MSLQHLSASILFASSLLIASIARADDAPAHVTSQDGFPYGFRSDPSGRQTHARSPGLAAGGVVLALAGAGSIAGGAMVIYNTPPSSGGFMDFSGLGRVGGAALVGLGLGCVGGAIAMIAIGAEPVPGPPQLSLGVSPSGISFSGRF